jgi:hypothetical protein
MSGAEARFPVDLTQYKRSVRLSFHTTYALTFLNRLKLDPSKPHLTDEQRQTLRDNIQLLRDVIILFTSTGAARGVSGHTGQCRQLDQRFPWVQRGTHPELYLIVTDK